MTTPCTALPTKTPCQSSDSRFDLRSADPIDAQSFATIRRRALLEGCKWDPQVGDLGTLSPFPLVMKSSVWKRLARQAEDLAMEVVAAEEEISGRPELLQLLGFPRPLLGAFAIKGELTPGAGRIMRFDFHNTTEGWRISEVNSDVPGGFTEASHFTAMIADFFPDFWPSGNPAIAWGDALSASAGSSGTVALLSAPGYIEDHQVIAFLAARLRERGCLTHLCKPEQIVWRDGFAYMNTAWYSGPVDTIVRFYQAEWLSRLPIDCGWHYFIRGGKTSVSNPSLAVLSESKRFPLVWEELSVQLPTWRALLPETGDPRTAPWTRDDGWLLKAAMCNTGDAIYNREWIQSREWMRTRFSAQCWPEKWVAQRRFESLPVSTPIGLRHACIGIYVVNGRAAGAYARLSRRPLIDFAAADVVLLLEDDD